MGLSTPIETITTRMKAQWAASSYSAVPVIYDNEKEDPPRPDPTDVSGSSWVRQRVLYDDTIGLTFSGSESDQTIGVAVYQIFIPLEADIDNGLGTGFAMAEAIRQFYNRNEDSGVIFMGPSGEGPSIQNVGRNEDTMNHQINVTVPWQFFDSAGGIRVSVNQIAVTQAAHGFANEWVGKSGGSYVEAGTNEAVGFATSAGTNDFRLTTSGPITWLSHGLSEGPIYLHVSTDGGSQSAVPGIGERYQRVGWAVDANTIIVQIEPMQGV